MCANVAVTHQTDGITALSRVECVHRVVRIVEGEMLNKASIVSADIYIQPDFMMMCMSACSAVLGLLHPSWYEELEMSCSYSSTMQCLVKRSCQCCFRMGNGSASGPIAE